MKVNGEERSLPQEGTVLGLLRELGHDPQRVAVEKNGSIVPRATSRQWLRRSRRPSRQAARLTLPVWAVYAKPRPPRLR